jgi:hypothetical protein
MSQRLQNNQSKELLSSLDDKHMFSPLTMMRIADKLQLKLSIHKPSRDMIVLMKVRLQRLGIASEDLAEVVRYISEIVPPGIENTAMSDFMAVFSFAKD